jgi:hypothetical protein
MAVRDRLVVMVVMVPLVLRVLQEQQALTVQPAPRALLAP